MRPFLQAFIVSSLIFLADAYSKQKKTFICYVTIFFIIAGMGFLFSAPHSSKKGAYAECKTYSLKSVPKKKKKQVKRDRKYYEKKEKFHGKEANKCYISAKSRVWYLPDLDDRQKARYCFTSALSACNPGDPRAKIVMISLSFLMQYGLDCIDEWNYIQNQLHCAAYHFEMSDFYFDLLRIHFPK